MNIDQPGTIFSGCKDSGGFFSNPQPSAVIDFSTCQKMKQSLKFPIIYIDKPGEWVKCGYVAHTMGKCHARKNEILERVDPIKILQADLTRVHLRRSLHTHTRETAEEHCQRKIAESWTQIGGRPPGIGIAGGHFFCGDTSSLSVDDFG